MWKICLGMLILGFMMIDVNFRIVVILTLISLGILNRISWLYFRRFFNRHDEIWKGGLIATLVTVALFMAPDFEHPDYQVGCIVIWAKKALHLATGSNWLDFSLIYFSSLILLLVIVIPYLFLQAKGETAKGSHLSFIPKTFLFLLIIPFFLYQDFLASEIVPFLFGTGNTAIYFKNNLDNVNLNYPFVYLLLKFIGITYFVPVGLLALDDFLSLTLELRLPRWSDEILSYLACYIRLPLVMLGGFLLAIGLFYLLIPIIVMMAFGSLFGVGALGMPFYYLF